MCRTLSLRQLKSLRISTVIPLFVCLFIVVCYLWRRAEQSSVFFAGICEGKEADFCGRPLQSFPSKYRTALPRYPITACVIEKSMSTFVAAIMCYLYDPETFLAANRSLHTEMYHSRFCIGKNEYTKFVGHGEKPTKMLIVTRDPLERFISGFVDKCLVEKKNKMGGAHCYNCKGNVDCFLRAQYKRVIDYGNARLKASQRNYYDIHFFPQNWYCGFREAAYDYAIVRYGHSGTDQVSMANELFRHLREQGVESNHIQYINNSLLSTRTEHATTNSTDKDTIRNIITSSRDLLRVFVRMFYYDYELFGFAFPTVNETE